MNLNDFNDYLDVELESDDVDTIAGFIDWLNCGNYSNIRKTQLWVRW